MVKNAATANYHSTSGCSWKTPKSIQKGMTEVCWVRYCHFINLTKIFGLFLINRSFAITSIVARICDAPLTVELRECLNCGFRAKLALMNMRAHEIT